MTYQDWIGRSETARDVLDEGTAARLLGALCSRELDPAAGALLLGHWLCFRPAMMRGDTGADGHPAKGGFLPPVPLPRRMWAGSRVTWERAIPLGAALERRSTIEAVSAKSGRSGELVFVTVRHEVADARGPILTEHQDIVYREAVGSGAAAQAAPSEPASAMPWSRPFQPDPVLLFRYSALTGNAHRIHYDLAYAQGEEGYPALVVHGPLTATLLLDHLVSHAGRPRSFAFRGIGPLFDTDAMTLEAGPPGSDGTARMQARRGDGVVRMTATAHFD
ncbi:FAS1-like dehydratase domain-containing protein [Novosphingobium resinovorum]|uniref:FAS1-like dehydratase domain-containing protein n=1 Tax=Novosphingobium resinovorum TaxID=158500 RepID=UPI002ED4A145|nr:MaoC family dehydratase N-terminal domain-containing protein [Novosphingobium resinovorum]